MKWVKRGLSILGFLFQYVAPLALFGTVFAFTHGGIKAGLTTTGYVAVAVFALIVLHKLKEKVLARKKGTARAILLSLFPVALWLVIFLGLNLIEGIVVNMAEYWDKVILFIILGRLMYIAEETMEAADET